MRSQASGDESLDGILKSLRPAKDQRLTVHLVANQVRGDSRVLKSAQVSMQCGHAPLIIGITPEAVAESFVLDGIPAQLLPMTIASSDRTALLRSWRFWDRYLSLGRAVALPKERVSFRNRVRSLARAVLRPISETSWSKQRPGLLDINLRFAATLTQVRPQLVHVHDAHGLPAALAYRARTVLSTVRRPRVLYDSHECISLAAIRYPKSPMHQAVSMIERELITSADEVLTVSQPIAAHLRDHYSLKNAPAVVHNCPEPRRDVHNADLRSVLDLGPETLLAVYSGWLEKQRGVETVVRALPLLPHLHLALVVNRDSGELKRLRALAQDIGVIDRLHVAPYVSPDAVADYLSSANFGVLPFEPFPHMSLSLPTKYYEHVAAQLPSLASDFGELAREITESGFGRVFRPGDSEDFAAQADTLVNSIDSYRDAIQDADLSPYLWSSQVPVLSKIYGRLSRAGDREFSRYVTDSLTLEAERQERATAQ